MLTWAAAPTTLVAAAHTHADAWFANGCAARTNVRFMECSFADLEGMPDGTSPDFDWYRTVLGF
jgi:hypothetical protein